MRRELAMSNLMSLVECEEECWIWTGPVGSHGYGVLYLPDGDGRRQWTAHRLSWTLHNGPIPDGLLVCHTCDVRRCVRPDHLFVGTHADNNADMAAKGRSRNRPVVGEAHHRAKITTADVIAMRRAHASGARGVDLAVAYGLSTTQVCSIVNRKSWKHVMEPAS